MDLSWTVMELIVTKQQLAPADVHENPDLAKRVPVTWLSVVISHICEK